jgi:hypothetical protein
MAQILLNFWQVTDMMLLELIIEVSGIRRIRVNLITLVGKLT